MVLANRHFDNLVPRNVLDKGGAFPVLGISQTQLAFLITAPAIDGTFVGNGEDVDRAGSRRDGNDVDIFEGGKTLWLPNSVGRPRQIRVLTSHVLPISGSRE